MIRKKIIPPVIFILIMIFAVPIGIILIMDFNFRDPEDIYYGFSNEQKITIIGYDLDAMEPYISRNGSYLFFNNYNGSNDKDIYYAEKIDNTTFQFKGEVLGINSLFVDGNPSMDMYGNFYFVSTRYYNPLIGNYSSIYSGIFNNGSVTDLNIVEGNIDIEEVGWINMGVEITGDGQTLYFSSAFFEGEDVPTRGNIRFAKKSGSQFIIPIDEKIIMQNINTINCIEYAGEVSENGLELFYSQVSLLEERAIFKLYYSNRSIIDEPFSVPMLISDPFEGNEQAVVEAPSLSRDGKNLYYHKFDNGKFSIFMLSRN